MKKQIRYLRIWSIYKAILSACLKCKNYSKQKPRVKKTNKGKSNPLLKCAACGYKKLKLLKKQDAKVFLGAISKLSLIGALF